MSDLADADHLALVVAELKPDRPNSGSVRSFELPCCRLIFYKLFLGTGIATFEFHGFASCQ